MRQGNGHHSLSPHGFARRSPATSKPAAARRQVAPTQRRPRFATVGAAGRRWRSARLALPRAAGACAPHSSELAASSTARGSPTRTTRVAGTSAAGQARGISWSESPPSPTNACRLLTLTRARHGVPQSQPPAPPGSMTKSPPMTEPRSHRGGIAPTRCRYFERRCRARHRPRRYQRCRR